MKYTESSELNMGAYDRLTKALLIGELLIRNCDSLSECILHSEGNGSIMLKVEELKCVLEVLLEQVKAAQYILDRLEVVTGKELKHSVEEA